jgi:HSP20 family molecular chaperone IbpA
MPFYTTTTLSPGDFLPLFQLMDDYCDTRQSTKSHESSRTKSAPTPPQISFTPKFDVREGNDSYILNGELPGAHQENIEIEFTDPETMVVKGRVDRNYNVATTSPESANNDDSMSVRSLDDDVDVDDASSTKSNYHSPTVEDENELGANAAKVVPQPARDHHVKPQPAAPTFKYWASERQIGHFQRTFTFPNRINQDGVRALFRNGILSITVPKETVKLAKRIRIE